MVARQVIPRRTLGKTGLTVPALGYGTGPVGFGFPHAEGVELVRYAIDRGITYLDTAHHYQSELVVGEAIQGQRDKIILATKTVKRNKAAAAADIATSLQQLRTDHIDILFMHCVNTIGDLDAVILPGGSLDAAIDAQRAGLVRYIGISGHARPNILARALDRYPFDVVLIAYGALDHLVTDPGTFFMPAARQAGCGVVGMKILGMSRLTKTPDLAIRWALSRDVHLGIVGMKSREEIDTAITAATNLAPLTNAEEVTLMSEARSAVAVETNPPFWLADMQVIAYREGWIGARHPEVASTSA